MATYTSDIVYSVKGMDQSTGQVIKLTDAITKLEKRGVPLSQSAQKAAAGIRAMDVATQSALQRLSGSNQSIDPLRMGLASLATQYIQTGRAASSSEAAIAKLSATQKSALAINNALLLGLGASALVAAGYAGSVIKTADAYTALRGKIAVYATDAANAAQVEERLFKVAAEARTSIEGVISLYSRLAPAFTDLGRSQAEAARFTELVSKALTAQGATSRETEASTVQLAQALASGVLRGDEFRSMMEASPGLMRQIAAGFETVGGKVGVPVGALRAMAEQGELTADKVIASIMRMQNSIETQFSKSPKTVSQAMTVLGNEMTRAIGQEMMDSGAQASMANSLLRVADSADEVVKALTRAGQAAIVLGAGLGGAKVIAIVGEFVALQRATYAAAMAIEAYGLAQKSALAGSTISAAGSLASNLPKISQAATAGATAFTGLNLATQATASRMASLGPVVDSVAARTANAARQNIVLDGSFAMQARTVENASRMFGSFNTAATATAVTLPAVANSAGALTTRVTSLTNAKNLATTALGAFRTAGGAVVTMLGGPWSIAIMAAIGALTLWNEATNKATQEAKGHAQALQIFTPIVSQYQEAMRLSAEASGKARDAHLQTAAAAQEQAKQQLAAARVSLAAAQARVSAASQLEVITRNSSGGGATAGMGSAGTLGAAANSMLAEGQLANAQGRLQESIKQLDSVGLRLNERGAVVPKSIAPSATARASSPSSASSASDRQGAGAAAATARAAAAAAAAETDANDKLALSLEAVDKWRTAERLSADLRYKDNPAAKAEALAAIEVQANAKRTQAHNTYEAAAERAAKADEAGANRSEAAARRVAARREREIALVEQYKAAAEQAAVQARADQTNDLSSKLQSLDAQQRAEEVSARLRIVNKEREEQALASIAAEYNSKREAARDAHNERMRALDEEANSRRRQIASDQARLEEGRANSAMSNAERLASEAGSAGKVGAAQLYIQAWEQAAAQAAAARARVTDAEIRGVEAASEKELEELKRRLGDTAEFAQRRIDLEGLTQDRIGLIRREAGDKENQEAEARIRMRESLEAEAIRAQAEKLRDQNKEWYSAGESSADAFRSALLTNKWDDLGRNIGNTLLAALYDSIIGNPLKNGIKGLLDDILGGGTNKSNAGSGTSIFKSIASIFGFANGGIMTPAGSMPLRAYAAGGIANSPQLAMFGEGRMPEAYVPLPDGRSIPVTMRAPYTDFAPGSRGGGQSISVVVAPQYNIDATGADPAALERVETRLEQMEKDLPSVVVSTVSEAMYNRQVA